MHFCAHNVLQNFQFIFIKFRMLPDPTDLLKSMFSMLLLLLLPVQHFGIISNQARLKMLIISHVQVQTCFCLPGFLVRFVLFWFGFICFVVVVVFFFWGGGGCLFICLNPYE